VGSKNSGFPAELAAAVKAGQHEAFRELYYTYCDSVTFFLTKLLGSEDEAKDVAQETFATLWEHRAQIDPAKNIKGYLFIIAKHASFRHIRRNSIYTGIVDDIDLDKSNAGGSDEEMIARETQLLVEIAVSRMPALRKSIYEMSRDQGLTNTEIAGKLGISRESVASHLYNALTDIKDVLTIFIALFVMGR
jgi:RNA polymerase sigma-70 factor (ECF subfamily)